MSEGGRATSASDYVGLLRRRWVYLATIAPTAILIAVYLAYSLPAMYQSSVTLLLELQGDAGGVVQTTVASAADQQIELVQQRVMTRDTLKELVVEFDPYPDEPGMSAEDKADQIIQDTTIERVDPVTFETLASSNAFSIHYQNADPRRAREMARKLATLFITYNQRTRADQAKRAYAFLLQQSKATAEEIREIEARMAQFKSKHGGALPDVRNQEAMDRTIRDLDGLESRLRLAEERESLLRVQLSQISPSLLGSVNSASPTDLPTLRAELAAAEQRYTPDHPDVKRLRRAIEALQLEAAKSPRTGAIKADNPEYLTVSSQLEAVQREAAALRSNVARARAQIANYESRLTSAPEIEREYAQIDREHQAARGQFDEIQEKLRTANLAQNLESGEVGERYSVLRAANLPKTPYSPNRLGLILIGFVLGGGLAVGAAVLVDSSDPTVRSSHDLRELTHLVTIGAVPVMYNEQDRRRRLWLLTAGAAVFGIATSLVAISVINSG